MSWGFCRVHLLVLVGDGTRVVRLELSRRLVHMLAGLVVLGTAGIITLALDSLALRREVQGRVAVSAVPMPAPTPPIPAVSTTAEPVESAGARLEAIRSQLAAMRSEIAG